MSAILEEVMMKNEITYEELAYALTTHGRYVGPLLEVHARSLLIHFSGRGYALFGNATPRKVIISC